MAKTKTPTVKPPLVQCQRLSVSREDIERYVDALRQAAPDIGDHGLNEEEFWQSGLFRGAIERIRGTQSATMADKKRFMSAMLEHLRSLGLVQKWDFSGSGERHDYEVVMADGHLCIIETKGCLDGNNTTIYERPPNADEFIIWSLCQNPSADPRYNAWSGLHTRLSAEMIHRKQIVDGVVIWDMVCGSPGRFCPKVASNPNRATIIGDYTVPPPCLFLMPRTIPDPRNNPAPPSHELAEVRLLAALHAAFSGDSRDVVTVQIQVRRDGPHVQRRTTFLREGHEIGSSKWTVLKRAN